MGLRCTWPQRAWLSRAVCSCVAIAGLVAVHGEPAGVSLHGTVYTIADIEAKRVELQSGSFIVGARKGAKEEVLQAMLDAFGWQPKKKFSPRSPMFAGTLNEQELLFLLRRPDVEFVENDGRVDALVHEPNSEL
mmetsp:Transcript_54473/g.158262  ORF Transcript_54473/g.158262 Transcript_54473/m.158262 type:complete len:134 (-) Transcript_54473:40-441(-)